MDRVVAFLLLPWAPAVALALLDPSPVPVFRDRIVVIVLAAVPAVLLSAALALQEGHGWGGAILNATITAAFSVGTVALVVVLILAGIIS